MALMLALLPGCWSVLEPTVPRGAMPKVAPGQVLLLLDADVVADHAQAQIDQHLQVNLARERELPEGLADAIEHRYLRSGMTPIQVLWVFRSHPTRIREQGPPGGRTWYWEPGRYWVRFDEAGQLVQAGQF